MEIFCLFVLLDGLWILLHQRIKPTVKARIIAERELLKIMKNSPFAVFS